MPGLSVPHHLLKFAQVHVHGIGDAIQPSHPLSSPSPPAPIPPSIRLFSNESTLRIRWPKYWSFSFSIIPSKEIPGLISFRMESSLSSAKLHFTLINLWVFPGGSDGKESACNTMQETHFLSLG